MRPGIPILLIVFLLGLVLATVFLHYRAKSLAEIDFRISYPTVPVAVTNAVREAEASYYESRGWLRKSAEEAEDILTFFWPPLVTALDLSVGPYRIKASTLEELLPWAVSEGYLTIVDVEHRKALQSISYFSEQPALADWGAAIILESLRSRHPVLKDMDWSVIANDPSLIAKLYSGYMGAGGDWDGWKATLEPGPEAKRRTGIKTTAE